ncbi:akirin-2-like [Denticeps clupeoides]|uniref:Akirin-2 n=1 Tax=Denticeps clupeoides TaxID=299321 RepID=A0AAY4ATE5_9TELE|nr:akirin-2-like [Denticeps clupeoides]
MACGATLKRTMDFDPLMSPTSPKRRRCVPVPPPSSSSSPRKYLRDQPSPFGEVSSRYTTGQILHSIKQEYKRMQKRKHSEGAFQAAEGRCSPEPQPGLSYGSGCGLQGEMSSPCSCPLALKGAPSGPGSPSRREPPLFTLRQVGMICERLLKEREDKVREEYEEMMASKLAEQYDTFVKFTHDQLMRRFEEQPASYVS